MAIIFKYFYQSANKLTALQKLYILYKVFSNNKINEIYYKIIDKDYHYCKDERFHNYVTENKSFSWEGVNSYDSKPGELPI